MKIKRLMVCMLAVLAFVPVEARVVLGKLGQTIKSATIYANPNTKSRRFYQARQYEYLVLRSSTTLGWYRVVLENMAYGYVRSDSVTCLPYEVTTQRPSSSRPAFPVAGRGAGTAVANYSLNFIGTKYRWGGTDMRNGVDCSAFVKGLYGAIGLSLPRTAAEQVKVGMPITRLEDLQPGDRLYFWSKSRNKVGHTGVYLGRGYFIHSSTTHKGVATDYLGTQKWLKMLVAARR